MTHSEEQNPTSGLKSCVWGFTLSILLTLSAYFFVTYHLVSPCILLYSILLFGFIQTVVQLVLFLHLGQEKKPYWDLATFLFMLSVLIIFVWGSIWIMSYLNYNIMPKMPPSP